MFRSKLINSVNFGAKGGLSVVTTSEVSKTSGIFKIIAKKMILNFTSCSKQFSINF